MDIIEVEDDEFRRGIVPVLHEPVQDLGYRRVCSNTSIMPRIVSKSVVEAIFTIK